MRKHFNTEGCCYPDEHYMVNPDSRLKKIKEMVDAYLPILQLLTVTSRIILHIRICRLN